MWWLPWIPRKQNTTFWEEWLSDIVHLLTNWLSWIVRLFLLFWTWPWSFFTLWEYSQFKAGVTRLNFSPEHRYVDLNSCPLVGNAVYLVCLPLEQITDVYIRIFNIEIIFHIFNISLQRNHTSIGMVKPC